MCLHFTEEFNCRVWCALVPKHDILVWWGQQTVLNHFCLVRLLDDIEDHLLLDLVLLALQSTRAFLLHLFLDRSLAHTLSHLACSTLVSSALEETVTKATWFHRLLQEILLLLDLQVIDLLKHVHVLLSYPWFWECLFRCVDFLLNVGGIRLERHCNTVSL